MSEPGTITSKTETTDKTGRAVYGYRAELLNYEEGMQISVPAGASGIRAQVQGGRLVVDYELPATFDSESGTDPGQADITYTVTTSTCQEPLATHRHFRTGGKWEISQAEWKKWKAWNDAGTDLTTVETEIAAMGVGFRKFLKKYIAGHTEYYHPRIVIRKTTPNAGLPVLHKNVKIVSPGVEVVNPGGINFIRIGMESTPEAVTGERTMVEEFLASDAGGWDPDIYGE